MILVGMEKQELFIGIPEDKIVRRKIEGSKVTLQQRTKLV